MPASLHTLAVPKPFPRAMSVRLNQLVAAPLPPHTTTSMASPPATIIRSTRDADA